MRLKVEVIGTCKLNFLSLVLDYNPLLNVFIFLNLCVQFFQTELMLLCIPVESRSPYTEEVLVSFLSAVHGQNMFVLVILLKV